MIILRNSKFAKNKTPQNLQRSVHVNLNKIENNYNNNNDNNNNNNNNDDGNNDNNNENKEKNKGSFIV